MPSQKYGLILTVLKLKLGLESLARFDRVGNKLNVKLRAGGQDFNIWSLVTVEAYSRIRGRTAVMYFDVICSVDATEIERKNMSADICWYLYLLYAAYKYSNLVSTYIPICKGCITCVSWDKAPYTNYYLPMSHKNP